LIAAVSLALLMPPVLKSKQTTASNWCCYPARTPDHGSPTPPGAIARNEALRATRRFGRTICRRWSGYHSRCRVETKMHCGKLLGRRLAARDFGRQVAEFQIRVAVLNGFTALGIPVPEAVG